MKLRTVKYFEHADTPQEWNLENLELGKINLIVGKNASGKTRSLNVINGLAGLVSGTTKLEYFEGNYDIEFEEGKKIYNYVLAYHGQKIEAEEYRIDGKVMMERKKGGKGKIWAEKIGKKGEMIDFQVPENELAVVARRDSIQHPYFEPLNKWGKSVLHFAFGSTLGREQLAVIVREKKEEDPIVRDTNKVIAVFRRGVEKFGADYTKAIIQDLKAVNYHIEKIELKFPDFIKIVSPPPAGELVALYVKEKGLDWINQTGLSQGMFRVLSVIIQMNYAQRTKGTECVLIDDIGEGLDFERSCSLIKLLIAKAEESSVQLVMTTNDRFIMNSVPLEYWSVLDRKGGNCHVYNYKNAKEIFEEFKFTGLNNFDFLATNFINEAKTK
jgi:energy-coupling factor transporter ATP-binding protein EcfA2